MQLSRPSAFGDSKFEYWFLVNFTEKLTFRYRANLAIECEHHDYFFLMQRNLPLCAKIPNNFQIITFVLKILANLPESPSDQVMFLPISFSLTKIQKHKVSFSTLLSCCPSFSLNLQHFGKVQNRSACTRQISLNYPNQLDGARSLTV